jgi:hypothetical protein
MSTFLSINWRSRGYLPHFDAVGMQQHIVFNLCDAAENIDLPEDIADRRKAMDAALDRGAGECLLARPNAPRSCRTSC